MGARMDADNLIKLQELLRQSLRLKSLLSAKACSTDPSAQCSHGSTCKALRESIEHFKACNASSCKDATAHAEDQGMLVEWDAHANDVLRKHCLRCRYALDGDEAISSLRSTIEALQAKSGVNTGVLQRHVAAAVQPQYRVTTTPSQAVQAAVAVLRTAPADRTRSVQYRPTHTHLNLLLSSVSNSDIVSVSSAIGLNVGASAAMQRVLVELNEAEKGAQTRQAQIEARSAPQDGQRAAQLAKLESAILGNVLVMAEKKNNLAERLRLVKEIAQKGRVRLENTPVTGIPGLATSDNPHHKKLHEALMNLEKAQAEATLFTPIAHRVGADFANYTELVRLLQLDHKTLFTTVNGQLVHAGYQDAPATDAGKLADEAKHTRYFVEAGVCSPGGAGLALRMADRAKAVGTGVDLAPVKAAPEAPGATWPRPSEQVALFAEVGASTPFVADAAPAATLALAELQAAGALVTDPLQLRRTVAAIVQKKALQSIQPAYTGEKDKKGSSAYAYMRDLVTTQALDLLSGVIATARARQLRELEALRVSASASATGAASSASSTVAAPSTGRAEPPMPAELRHGGAADGQTVWRGISAAWGTWYGHAQQYVLTQAKMGFYNRKAVDASLKELFSQIPQPGADVKSGLPSAASGPVSLKALHESSIKAACHSACKAWYESALREQIHRASISGAAVDLDVLRKLTPEEVDRLLRLAGRRSDSSSAAAEPTTLLQQALHQTAAVDGEGKLVLPGTSAASSDAEALASGVNARITVADVMAYLHSQLTGGTVGSVPAHMSNQGSADGQEGETGLAEGERQAPLFVHVLQYARDSAASSYAALYGGGTGGEADQEATEHRDAEQDDAADATDAEGDRASVMTGRHSESGGQAAHEKAAPAGAAAAGGAGRAKRQTAGKNSKFLEDAEASGAGRKRGRAADAGEEEELSKAAPAKRSNAGRVSGGGHPKGTSAEGETTVGRTSGAEVKGSFLNFDDVHHPLHRARALAFLPGRPGGDQQGETTVADLHARLARLREIAPPISRHPRAVSFMRLALARAREHVALSQEGSDLREEAARMYELQKEQLKEQQRQQDQQRLAQQLALQQQQKQQQAQAGGAGTTGVGAGHAR